MGHMHEVFQQVSQYNSTEVTGMRSFSSCRTVLHIRSVRSWSLSSAAASAPLVTDVVIASSRERVSAKMLSYPDMLRMSVVNWEIKSRWLK